MKLTEKLQHFYTAVKPLKEKADTDNIYAIAGQSAFYFLLAFVPLTIFAVSILQSLHIPVETLDRFLGDVLNKDTSEYFSSFLSNVYYNTAGISALSLVITLWSASKGIHAIINGLNRIHRTNENRNWILLRIRAMLITLMLIIVLLLTMLTFVLGTTISGILSPYISNMPDVVELFFSLRYLLLYAYLIILFSLIYRNVPNLEKQVRRRYGIKDQLPGAILSATAWLTISVGISVYVDDFNGFSFYGGLTRLAMIMVWLYMCLMFLMLGAEINYVYHDEICSAKKRIFFKNKKNSHYQR